MHVTGERTLFTTATTDASGATHVTLHGTPGRLSGVGLTTGDTYHVIGHEDLSINTTGSESASTFTGRSAQRWVLPGGGNDFTVRSVFHITTDPNGDLHFVPRETTVECS